MSREPPLGHAGEGRDFPDTFHAALFASLLLAAGVTAGIVLLVAAEVFFVKAFLKQNAQRGKRRVLFFNNKGSMLDFLPIVVFAVVLIVVFFWSRTVWADIPYAIHKDFTVTTGVVVTGNPGGAGDGLETREFDLQDFKTGQIIRLLVIRDKRIPPSLSL